MARDSANGDNAAISATNKSGQLAGNEMIDTEDGFENRGIISQECFAGKEVQESDMNVDNLCLDIGSEQASSLPVASVAVSHGTTEAEVCDDIGSGNAVQFSSDGSISIGDGSVRNNIGISKEVKLDCAVTADHVIDHKPVNHDVLLQKLEEDLSDDEPVETSLATESSSHSVVNNKVEDVGVLCKNAPIKDFERDAEPEKGTTISIPRPIRKQPQWK